MSSALAAAVVARAGKSVSMMPCRIVQVTPLLVSFDGGTSTVPGLKVAGLSYSTSTTNNAVAFLQSPSPPLVLPIG